MSAVEMARGAAIGAVAGVVMGWKWQLDLHGWACSSSDLPISVAITTVDHCKPGATSVEYQAAARVPYLHGLWIFWHRNLQRK